MEQVMQMAPAGEFQPFVFKLILSIFFGISAMEMHLVRVYCTLSVTCDEVVCDVDVPVMTTV